MAVFTGTDAPDLIDRSSGDASSVFGLKGADTLIGSPGNDTLNGGSGRDSLIGGAGNDSIDGGEDPDFIDGGAGNDTLDGDYNPIYDDGGEVPWTRDDTLLGGPGDDSLRGGSGNDHFTGGPGNDTLDGSGDFVYAYYSGTRSQYSVLYLQQSGAYRITDNTAGRDGVDTAHWVTMFVFSDGTWTQKDMRSGSFLPSGGGLVLNGTEGNDSIEGDYGPDSITGGGGVDVLDGSVGDDTVSGGAGGDFLEGGHGNDRLDGGDGDDALSDIYGSNTLIGGAGHDQLRGGFNADLLIGGDGNDSLRNSWDFGDHYADTLIGGVGDDSFVAGFMDNVDAGDGPVTSVWSGDRAHYFFHEATGPLHADFRPMAHGAPAVMSHGSASGLEFITEIFGSGYADFFGLLSVRGGYSCTVDGWHGNDTIVSGAGRDSISGGDGTDTVVVEGYSWEYTVGFDGWTYTVTDKLGRFDPDELQFVEFLQFADGVMELPEPINYFQGTESGDYYSGSSIIRDSLAGGGGSDTLFGLFGNDTLVGGTGNDSLWGGEGDDLLVGGDGDDSHYGDDGFDAVILELPWSQYYVRNEGTRAYFFTGYESTDGWYGEESWTSVDTTSHVERVLFPDISLAFDFAGNAEHALRFLATVLGSGDLLEPGAVGIALALVDAGWTDAQIAGVACAALYANASNADFVSDIYANAFGEAPAPALRQEIVQLIQGGFATRESLVALVAQSAWIEPVVDAAIEEVRLTGLRYVETMV